MTGYFGLRSENPPSFHNVATAIPPAVAPQPDLDTASEASSRSGTFSPSEPLPPTPAGTGADGDPPPGQPGHPCIHAQSGPLQLVRREGTESCQGWEVRHHHFAGGVMATGDERAMRDLFTALVVDMRRGSRAPLADPSDVVGKAIAWTEHYEKFGARR